MAERKENAAYDLSLFEEKKPSVVALEPNKKAQREMQKRARWQSMCHALSFIVSVGVVLAVVALMIVSRVRLTEMNEAISELDEQIAILESESIRLHNELSGMASAESIEAYAQAHGMQKVESHQIEYFTMDTGDRVEVPAAEDDSWIDRVASAIGSLFS